MHLLGPANRDQLIFGPWFLVPFGMSLAVLLLEIGLVSGIRTIQGIALALPLGLFMLTLIGHRDEAIYRDFLNLFSARLGGDPLHLTLLVLTSFYAYAALRRVRLAAEALTGVLAALAILGPDTLNLGETIPPRPLPILAAALLQLGLGAARRSSWRCLLGAGGMVLAAALELTQRVEDPLFSTLIIYHLAMVAVLGVAAAFDDWLGRFLRIFGSALVLEACLAVLFGDIDPLRRLPAWLVSAYVPTMALLLVGYGWLLRYRPAQGAGGVALGSWLSVVGWAAYRDLRDRVMGLDQIVLSLAVFAMAVLVSLAKSGRLSRWLTGHGWIVPRSSV
jgi:hypothetical protein